MRRCVTCIINVSRAITHTECTAKSFFRDVRNLTPQITPDALITGGAYHHGSAEFFAKRDPAAAVALAEKYYRAAVDWKTLLPEEVTLHERNITFVKRALRQYADNYKEEQFQVLMPEVEFCVPLPSTLHHCYFVHKILYPEDKGDHPACSDNRCYIPHHLKGKTDAVIAWRSMIWLLEQKTSSVSGDIFWAKWALDVQPTAYLYGIWKSTGTQPHGFVINLIKKPRKNAKDPLDIQFEREPFLRDTASLLRVERELSIVADSFENMVRTGEYIHSGAMHGQCVKWNRRCPYFAMCARGTDQPLPGEFVQRDPDYVDAEYYKLLGLPVPDRILAGIAKREGTLTENTDADA